MLMEAAIALARWWPWACLKCVSDLPRQDETLNFLRSIHVIDLVLKYGPYIHEGNWLQLFFASLYWLVWLRPLLEWVFFSCVSDFRLKFSRIALWRKRLQLNSKSDLVTNELILGFFVRNGFMQWPNICMDWHLQELLNCYSLLTASSFFSF